MDGSLLVLFVQFLIPYIYMHSAVFLPNTIKPGAVLYFHSEKFQKRNQIRIHLSGMQTARFSAPFPLFFYFLFEDKVADSVEEWVT